MLELTDLCIALSIFGSIPEGNISLEVQTEEVQVHVYSQQDKKKVYRLLCYDRDLGEIEWQHES